MLSHLFNNFNDHLGSYIIIILSLDIEFDKLNAIYLKICLNALTRGRFDFTVDGKG